MHWIVPFAAPLSEAGRAALRALELPKLDALLAQRTIAHRDDGEADSLSPPHERALARALGLAGADGELPWAARFASQHGVDTADLAWGLLTPVHWEVATDHIRLSDPAQLKLGASESRRVFEALHPLFESEGVALVFATPHAWLAAHESLRGLATASIDRVIGRALDGWLPPGDDARLMRRLQNEAQMLLHTHELNADREEVGAPPVNSFWLSGCGLHQRENPRETGAAPELLDTLRAPALAEDWAAWAEAWHAIDERIGRTPPDTLTLCGERGAVEVAAGTRSLWQRLTSWRNASAASLLESL